MAATTLRSDIRTEVRDYISEVSGITGAIWSEVLLNRAISREVRSLGRKGLYIEEQYSFSQVVTDGVGQRNYDLPDGWIEVEKLERNDNTTADPDWTEVKGWDTYGDTIYLPYEPSDTKTLRIWYRKHFTVPTGDTTALDIPNDKCEVLVWGVVIRAYHVLVGYLRGSKSWDTVTKPGDLSIPVIQNYLRDALVIYRDLVRQYSHIRRPRDIDLVGGEWSL